MLTEGEVRDLEEGRRRLNDEYLKRLLGDLLEERRWRIAHELTLSRELHHLRQRLLQGFRYLANLASATYEVSRRPWPGKLPCPVCGAPATMTRAEWRPEDRRTHVLVHDHEDGSVCADPERQPNDPSPAEASKRG